jgi:hypothetical protein
MKRLREAGAALLLALAACTDAGPRDLAGPEDARPALNQVVTTVNICCSATLYKGSSYQVYLNIYDQNGQPMYNQGVYWYHGNNGVASIWGSGHAVTVNAVNVGSTTIYALVGGITRSVNLTVIAAPVVTTVTVTPSPVSVQVGASRQLTAKAYDQYNNLMSGKTATWTIDNSSVATVSSGGNLQGVAVGSTTVRATIDGVQGTASVGVQPQLSVSISGPLWVNNPGTQTWTANASGGNGTYSYRWYVEWNTSPTLDVLGTGSTESLYIDGNSPSFFIVTVEVTSGTQTVSASEGVCNFTASAMC